MTFRPAEISVRRRRLAMTAGSLTYRLHRTEGDIFRSRYSDNENETRYGGAALLQQVDDLPAVVRLKIAVVRRESNSRRNEMRSEYRLIIVFE